MTFQTKKAPKCTRLDRKGIHWNFAYLPRGNGEVCIFAREEFFPLRGPLLVALLSLPNIFELGKFY